MLDTIPQARAMQLQLLGYQSESLCLRAPLAANVNDKGCAFGGSLSALMTLAGWALVVLALKARGDEADVFVARAEVRYIEPLFDDLEVSAQWASNEDRNRFFDTLSQRGKARVCIESQVRGANGPACMQTAYFVAKRQDRAQ